MNHEEARYGVRVEFDYGYGSGHAVETGTILSVYPDSATVDVDVTDGIWQMRMDLEDLRLLKGNRNRNDQLSN